MNRGDLRNTDLNLLLVFEVLMAERHVGRAAERLCLTQSAVSHSLRRLRTALDDPLFVRNPKGVEPTPRAVEIAPTVSQALEGARSVLMSAPTFDPDRPHTFSIGATDGATNAILVPLAEHLRATAPEISLRVIATNRANVVEAIDRMQVDLALSAFSTPVARLTRVPIRKIRFVGIARHDHPALRGRNQLGLDDFAELPHLVISPDSARAEPIDEYLSPLGIKRRIAMSVPHYLAAPLLVARTDLVAIVDRKLALIFAATGQLMLFDLPFESPSTTIDMLFSSMRVNEPPLRWLRTQISMLFDDEQELMPNHPIER